MNPRILLRMSRRSAGTLAVAFAAMVIVFTSVIISLAYIRYETGFDTFFPESDRIGRMHVSSDGERPDGRIYSGFYDHLLEERSDIRKILRLSRILTTTVSTGPEKIVVNDVYTTVGDYFELFPLELVEGSLNTAMDGPLKAAVSRSLAITMFGGEQAVGRTVNLSGRAYGGEIPVVIGAVFEDFPAQSHMHTDMIVRFPDGWGLGYYYLLLEEGTDFSKLSENLEAAINQFNEAGGRPPVNARVMPLTDIHLRSNAQRELRTNGNIQYIYLIGGANILLLLIVLFNLWLNSRIIHSHDRRFHSLLRINGAPTAETVKFNLSVYSVLVITAFAISLALSFWMLGRSGIGGIGLRTGDILLAGSVLILLSLSVLMLESIKDAVKAGFKSCGRPAVAQRMNFSAMKWMLLFQYAIAVLIMVTALGIHSQLKVIGLHQAGAGDPNIIVMSEQPSEVIANYSLLREQLLKYPAIESVTGAMQVPGAAVRDMITVYVDDQSESLVLPLMSAGEDFLPFFGVGVIAGRLPGPPVYNSFMQEMEMSTRADPGPVPVEEIAVTRSAASALGFSSPDQALGAILRNTHESLDYIPLARIVGVTEDFVITSVYEKAMPLLIYQRHLFMNCFMISFSPGMLEEGIGVLRHVWNEVNPDYALSYSFLDDTYKALYHNENSAAVLVSVFSLLTLVIILLGLIINISFMVGMRTREIAVRKVNGATPLQIVVLVNRGMLSWMLAGSALAVPLALWLIGRWLNNFAYKAVVGWTECLAAVLIVIVLSLVSVSHISIRASRINPAESMKRE